MNNKNFPNSSEFQNRPSGIPSTQSGMNCQNPSSQPIQLSVNQAHAHLQTIQQQQQQFHQQQHCKNNQNCPSNNSQSNYDIQSQNLPKQPVSGNQSQSALQGTSSGSSLGFPVTNEQIFEKLLKHEVLIKQLFELLSHILIYVQKSEPTANQPAVPNPQKQSPPPPKVTIYLADSSVVDSAGNSSTINENRFKQLILFLQESYQINLKILKENDPVVENSVILFPVLLTTPRSPSGELITSKIKIFRRNNTPIISVILIYTEVWETQSKPDTDVLFFGLSYEKGIYIPNEVKEKNKLQLEKIQGKLK